MKVEIIILLLYQYLEKQFGDYIVNLFSTLELYKKYQSLCKYQ